MELTVEEFERRMDTVGVNRESVGLPFKRSLDELDAGIKPKEEKPPERDVKAIYNELIMNYTDKAIPYDEFMAICDCADFERHQLKYQLQKYFKANGYTLRTNMIEGAYRFYKIPTRGVNK